MKRSPNRYKTEYKLADTYAGYKKENPRGSDFYVKKDLYVQINKLMFAKIRKHILEDSDTIMLPYRMGTISVIKKKMNYDKLPYDFGTFKKEGIKIKLLNDHSDGYKFKFRWSKKNVIVKNRSYYCFIPCRDMCRDLAKLIKLGKVDYPRI